jgi:hypothetical protein
MPRGTEPSAQQQAMLADGEVTFGEYEAAIATSLSCLEDAGFDVIGPTHNDRQGFTLIDYSYSEFAPGMTREQGSAVADACLDEHSTLVEAAYQLGPIAVEGRDQFFEDFREPFIACVVEHGGDIADDALRDEVEQAAVNVLMSSGTDCWRAVDSPP